MLGAICGSAISMDLLAQSIILWIHTLSLCRNPWIAQISVDRSGQLLARSAGNIRRPASDIIAHVFVVQFQL